MLDRYKTIIFDCDGVILNSNKIKTDAFYKVCLPFGKDFASQMIDFHRRNGGVSRNEKFRYFKDNILPKNNVANIDSLLSIYAGFVEQDLLNCEISDSLSSLRMKYQSSRWLVISGGNQAELRKLFTTLKINSYFNGGIFGSPEDKETLLFREIKNNNIEYPAVFLGDSFYDHRVAQLCEVDFIFINGWTEARSWKSYVGKYKIKTLKSLGNLCSDIYIREGK